MGGHPASDLDGPAPLKSQLYLYELIWSLFRLRAAAFDQCSNDQNDVVFQLASACAIWWRRTILILCPQARFWCSPGGLLATT